jgi:hypothetical protein
MPKDWKPPKKFVFASAKELGYYQPWVDEIIQVMCDVTGEEKPLFISDESMIGDMPLEKEDLKKMSEILGIPVKPTDFILDLAKSLKKSRE